MSDRLISADKAKEVLKHLLYETAMNNELDIADIYEDIIENRLNTWIELIPTVDAEPEDAVNEQKGDATESSPQFYYGAVKVVRSADGRPYPVLSYHDIERREDVETN